MSPVIGNVTLMSRFSQSAVALSDHWDFVIDLSKFQYYQQCLTEVKCWSSNIVSLNNRNLLGHHGPTAIFYSDASAYACGGHVFFIDRTDFDLYFTAFSSRE